MSVIVGYAYFSRQEYNDPPGGFPDTWVAPMRVYAINSDASLDFLGTATYTAGMSDYDAYRFGYTPPNEGEATIPYVWEKAQTTPPEYRQIDLLDSTERSFVARLVPGYNLGEGGAYDLSGLPSFTPEIDKLYAVVASWVSGSAWPVVSVTEIGSSYWTGLAETYRHYASASIAGDVPPPVTPPFWTAFVGTEETP